VSREKVQIRSERPIYPSPAGRVTSVDATGNPNIITLGEIYNLSIRQPVIVGIGIAPARYSHQRAQACPETRAGKRAVIEAETDWPSSCSQAFRARSIVRRGWTGMEGRFNSGSEQPLVGGVSHHSGRACVDFTRVFRASFAYLAGRRYYQFFQKQIGAVPLAVRRPTRWRPRKEKVDSEMPEALVSQAGMRIVRLLVGNPPQTIAQLIRATGVTRTAVSEQLAELVASGFAARTVERLPGRGRPRYLYSATQAALVLLFARSQQLIVPSIWRAVDQVGGRELTKKILKRVTQSVADFYRPRVTGRTPRERLRQLVEAWTEEGHLIEMIDDSNGHLMLRKRSCGYISMFEESQAVCNIDKEVIEVLVQAPVRRVECRHDGEPCCAFELCPIATK